LDSTILYYGTVLSHNWKHGQGKMRIVKKALEEMMPGASVFLDVDNLGGGSDHPHIDVSSCVLCFCTERWFSSGPCVREVVRAVLRRKPLIVLLEPDTSDVHGGLSEAECRAILQDERLQGGRAYSERLEEQRDEVARWSDGWAERVVLPTAAEVEVALFESAPLVWSPLADFQAVTLRIIGERLLPETTHAYGMQTHGSARAALHTRCWM
jgi:hypothetical protein